ncbi:MAG: lytic transglycosylase domain-containing protein [Candidatus Kapabacteria bacterium]|nr:lytic transglycosylase domain-containing protein [Ignavibacteriota bacterium]MCW5884231.1 lytic transglycosylase domain-containing protein [Candidatus Kapabacteria bacterium]
MKIIYLLLSILLFSCSDSKPLISESALNAQNHFEFISSLDLPEKLDFCGEELPLDDPEIRERAEREFYLMFQQPGQIMLYLKRSGRYFPMFREVIKEHNMPEDLVYLSVAESALYMSRSSAGAIGLWQFMPETAKMMGLRVDDFVDERRHPEKATHAAMKYLKQGYNKHKSWILTAAGYNMGHTGLAENLNFQSVENYFDLHLNEETSRYIFRIAIIKNIMQNAERYGFKVSEERKYSADKVKLIKVTSALADLSAWARAEGTSYKHVKRLNPWILKRSLPAPAKGSFYEIAIPD